MLYRLWIPNFSCFWQCKSSISDCPITHPSLLLNPFLGLPLEAGRCESCGTAEPGQCEGTITFSSISLLLFLQNIEVMLRCKWSVIWYAYVDKSVKSRSWQGPNAGLMRNWNYMQLLSPSSEGSSNPNFPFQVILDTLSCPFLFITLTMSVSWKRC